MAWCGGRTGRLSVEHVDEFTGQGEGAAPKQPDKADGFYVALLFTNAVLLFFAALGVVVQGGLLVSEVVTHPQWGQFSVGFRKKALTSMLGMMILCASCYLLRLVLLVPLAMVSQGGPATVGAPVVRPWRWRAAVAVMRRQQSRST